MSREGSWNNLQSFQWKALIPKMTSMQDFAGSQVDESWGLCPEGLNRPGAGSRFGALCQSAACTRNWFLPFTQQPRIYGRWLSCSKGGSKIESWNLKTCHCFNDVLQFVSIVSRVIIKSPYLEISPTWPLRCTCEKANETKRYEMQHNDETKQATKWYM